MNVTAVKANPKQPEQGFVTFEDGSEAWTPKRELAEALIGKPVPGDWTLRDGEYGKQLLPPRESKGGGGGPAAWRNTEAGARFEQAQMNRRTALMQAVSRSDGGRVLGQAQRMFDWLQNVSAPRQIAPTGGAGKEQGDARPVDTGPGIGVGADTPTSSGEPQGQGEGPSRGSPDDDTEWSLCSGSMLVLGVDHFGTETALLNAIRKLTHRNTEKHEVTDRHIEEALK